jgi:two-component sensor histidine kinase
MIGENRPISLKVSGEGGSATFRQAESLGLIATELVINSLKHAFSENTKMGRSPLRMTSGTDLKLSIADNGVGKPGGGSVPRLKLWPAQRERPCRSLMALFWQRCPVSCERR